MSKVTAEYNIIHPQKKKVFTEMGTDSGVTEVDDKQMLIITLSKHLNKTQFGEAEKFVRAIMSVDGVDAFQALGQYSVQLVLANTFDYDTVIEDIKAVIEKALSSIVIPLKSNAPKLSI